MNTNISLFHLQLLKDNCAMVMILFEKGIFATAFFLLTFFFEVLTVFSVLGRKGKGRAEH